MLPAQRLEIGVIQGLDADRQAVDASRAIAAKPRGFDAGRIGFERDLGLRVEPPGGADGVDDPLHGLGAHQRGRAAAEEHRAHLAARRQRRAMGDFGLERREIALLVDSPAADMAVEVAIGTFRQAERPMDIDPEPGVGRRARVGARGKRGDAANHRALMPANRPQRQNRSGGVLSRKPERIGGRRGALEPSGLAARCYRSRRFKSARLRRGRQ